MRLLGSSAMELKRAIDAFWNKNHYGPTLDDLTEITTMKTKSNILRHIRIMRACGHILFDDNISRSVRTVEMDSRMGMLFNTPIVHTVNRFERIQERYGVNSKGS